MHPVVFLSYDMDTAGEKGMTVLASDLAKIPGLTVFKYPVSGCHHDFNDYLTSDRRNAENRIRLAKGLALGLKNHLIDEDAVRSCIDELGRHDASGDGGTYCEKALRRLKRLWAGPEWDHSEAGGPE